MLLRDLPTSARDTLDQASSGLFTRLLHTYDEVHLTAQTHLEGLRDGEVKLYIMIMQGNTTLDYAVASLGGSARLVGLRVYIQDKLDSARAIIAQVVAKDGRLALLH